MHSLTVTGSVSVTVSETSNSANTCQTASGGVVSGILSFDTYSLQFAIATGTTTFPSTAGNFGVAFFNNNDFTSSGVGGVGRDRDAQQRRQERHCRRRHVAPHADSEPCAQTHPCEGHIHLRVTTAPVGGVVAGLLTPAPPPSTSRRHASAAPMRRAP